MSLILSSNKLKFRRNTSSEWQGLLLQGDVLDADLVYAPDTYSLTLATAYGVVTGGGTTCSIYIPTPKSLARVSHVSVELLSTALRHTGGGYIGGSSDFNALPYIDGAARISSNGQIYINITRSSGWGVTNNTPVAGTLDIRFTLS